MKDSGGKDSPQGGEVVKEKEDVRDELPLSGEKESGRRQRKRRKRMRVR